MLDLICLHLSDPLFDLVLKLVHDYTTTNAKSNAVKAIGQLISSLALARPAKTIDKFLPFCLSQIKDELKHGASGVRTTSSHAAIPSDTTLHWSTTLPLSDNYFVDACSVQTCPFCVDVSATTELRYV